MDKTNFHMKGFALGLALEQRWKATRKWPVKVEIFGIEGLALSQLHLWDKVVLENIRFTHEFLLRIWRKSWEAVMVRKNHRTPKELSNTRRAIGHPKRYRTPEELSNTLEELSDTRSDIGHPKSYRTPESTSRAENRTHGVDISVLLLTHLTLTNSPHHTNSQGSSTFSSEHTKTKQNKKHTIHSQCENMLPRLPTSRNVFLTNPSV